LTYKILIMKILNHIDIFETGYSFFIADTIFSGTKKTGTHTHNFYEFFILRQGELIHYHNHEKYIMKPGEICFIHPADHHSFQATHEGVPAIFTNVAFTTGEYEMAIRYLQCKGFETLSAQERKVLPDNHSLSALLAGFENIFRQAGSSVSADLHFLFRALLIQALVILNKKSVQTQDTLPLWLSVACHQMEKTQNYQKGIPRFVELSGKTQEHLTRSLKKYLNTTPSEFINNIRLLEAAKQLRNTTKPVSEIVFATGFENPSYFNRLFKAKYGQSPGKYRLLNLSIVNAGVRGEVG
jgi:AraC family transcriptional regulator, dual regulator of chb operon